ncbi:MAG: hypothetical protein D6682_03450 [Zetaproteobacteria bacterium]|nr:MAG: hypothetical protein D6682_03450 [Zetaproteobacteria bacterium]
MRNDPLRRPLPAILLLLTLFFVSSAARIAWIAHQQNRLAHDALLRHDTRRAIIHFERSIHAWLPFLSNPACTELPRLLHRIERERPELALEGWRRLRGAIKSTRNIFGQPNRTLLAEANRHIARLAARTDKEHRMTPQAIERELTGLLAREPRDVNRFWGVVQFLLLLAWVGLGCRLIWLWPRQALHRRMRLLAAAVGCWIGWLGALYLAG